ncbi:uncharacterized protein [Musca autumnalis]|uniref:uncharacterized protein n=1 Tax=Musca autumnalis TaxID=221902 RepID=UPI003CF66E71
MKSLALNLFQKILPLLLVLLLLLLATVASSATAARTTKTTTTSPSPVEVSSSSPTSSRRHQFAARTRFSLVRTTTPVPPSLPRPPQLRRRFSTTTSASTIPMPTSTPSTTTTTPKAKMAQRQRRLPQAARQHAAASAEITTSKPAILSEASTTLASTRLVRHVDATTPKSNSNTNNDDGDDGGIRQHRSFQSNNHIDRRSSSSAPVLSEENVVTMQHKTQIGQKRRTFGRTPITTEGTSSNSNSAADDSTSARFQRFRITTKSVVQQSSTAHFDSRQSLKTTSSSLPSDADPRKTTSTTSKPPPTGGNSNNIKLTTQHSQQQTPKTPRMIHRLVAGHIQNNDNRPAATSNNSSSNTRIKYILPVISGSANSGVLSSSYRDNKLNANIRIADDGTKTHKDVKTSSPDDDDNDYHDDDEALLDDSVDFDNWDNGILRLSAGSGKENTLKPKKNKDDSKKTLADQVKDGKYGLIEKELFRRPPNRPGVLSYLPNKEVPDDNERNFGGLNEEDIWLAEDHLLVIKGGSLNEDNPAEPWPAIDDYNAAGRPIKIPDNPKVPPPFPVQLEENGPVQLIGNNKLTVVYPVSNEPLSIYSSTSTQINNASPESDSDDEKNLITRPGALKGVKENEDAAGYNYASPPLPWLVANNQTSVDTSSPLNKPVSYPVLGPFLYGRNGSLDNATDDFDEDDPSLYYPPPYSFVYKSNYTNAVPPGPLVPGIVVPPPPEQFSKLEKSEKERRPVSGVSTPIRYRVYSTTSTTTPLPIVTTTIPTTTTTSTTTTSTTTTTESPYRNSITKISEYTPKIIHIASPSPRPVYTPTTSPIIGSRIPTKPAPTQTPQSPQHIQPVPVPVAVPIPIYSANVEQNIRPGTISFVPTTPEPNVESFSKSNPIYYEYFEAKRQHQQQGTSQLFDEFLSSTVKPYPTPSPKPIKLYNTSKRPYKNRYQQNNLPANHRYVDENIVVITPKPEVRLKQRPYYKPRPVVQNYEQDVTNIRDGLRYYQNQELRDNNIPRTPKAKPVFDYNYDSSKSVTPDGSIRNTFQPPLEYDVEPFQPMVTYSPPLGDEDSFKAVNVDKADNVSLQPQGREEPIDQEQYLYSQQPKYVSTTTLVPIPQPERSKKLRAGAKYLHQNHQYQQQRQQQFQQQQQYRQQQQQQQLEYNRWVAVNKQEFETRYTGPENVQRPRERYQEPAALQPPQSQRNRDGYYYGPARQNNRFYEEPFQNAPNRKIINYRPPPTSAPQLQVPQQQLSPQPVWSLENDTYVNYAPNRPPLNPDAEFINPYQTIPVNAYQQQQQQQQQQRLGAYQQQQQQQSAGIPPPPPPALSHQSQYYAPPLAPQRLPSRQFQSPQPVSLHRDILVNYRQPLPPINPDSEYISHPQVVRNPIAVNPYYRNGNTYRPATIPVSNLNIESEADVYFLTPKFRRANNLNPNNNNNNNADNRNQQQQQNGK